MKKKILLILMLLLSFTVNANAALIDNGDGTITDTDRGLMWLQNANLAGHNFDYYCVWGRIFSGCPRIVFITTIENLKYPIAFIVLL